jgi:hypothetical protein
MSVTLLPFHPFEIKVQGYPAIIHCDTKEEMGELVSRLCETADMEVTVVRRSGVEWRRIERLTIEFNLEHEQSKSKG